MRERRAAGRNQRDRREDLEDRRAEEDQEPEPDHELRQGRQDEKNALGSVIERPVTVNCADRS